MLRTSKAARAELEGKGVKFNGAMIDSAVSLQAIFEVMISVDYPYETMTDAAGWFDSSLLCHNESLKIGRDNAVPVSGLDQPASTAPSVVGVRAVSSSTG